MAWKSKGKSYRNGVRVTTTHNTNGVRKNSISTGTKGAGVTVRTTTTKDSRGNTKTYRTTTRADGYRERKTLNSSSLKSKPVKTKSTKTKKIKPKKMSKFERKMWLYAFYGCTIYVLLSIIF